MHMHNQQPHYQPNQPKGFFRSLWDGSGGIGRALMISLVLSAAATILFRNVFVFFLVLPLYPIQTLFRKLKNRRGKFQG